MKIDMHGIGEKGTASGRFVPLEQDGEGRSEGRGEKLSPWHCTCAACAVWFLLYRWRWHG